MNIPEKKSRVISSKKRAVRAENEVSKLRAKISQLTEKYGEYVDNSLHMDMVDTMKEFSPNIECTYPEGSLLGYFGMKTLAPVNYPVVHEPETDIKLCILCNENLWISGLSGGAIRLHKGPTNILWDQHDQHIYQCINDPYR